MKNSAADHDIPAQLPPPLCTHGQPQTQNIHTPLSHLKPRKKKKRPLILCVIHNDFIIGHVRLIPLSLRSQVNWLNGHVWKLSVKIIAYVIVKLLYLEGACQCRD